jgi:hypothetical protein
MNDEDARKIIEIARRKATEFFDEVAALFPAQGAAPEPAAIPEGWHVEPEDLGVLERPAPDAAFEVMDELEDEFYRWPDGNVDRYEEYVRYRGTGAFAGGQFALGHLSNGDVVGFVLGPGGGSKRGLTYFFAADDFHRSNERVSMIRGGGPHGRAGFSPLEPRPEAYAAFKLQPLRERKAGKWNVQAVVVDAEDTQAMLLHTALQARLRGLV